MIRSNHPHETPRWSWDRRGLLIITRRLVLGTGIFANVYS